MKAFKKGDKVTLVRNWDGVGTFYFIHAVVASCGAKQMTLIDAATGETLGRHFEPVRGCLGSTRRFEGCYPAMDDAPAAALCLAKAAEFIAHERARVDGLIERSDADGADRHYVAALRKKLATLIEPQAFNAARPAEIFTAAPDEGFDAEDAAEVERERSASIAADIEASRQRTLASLAELDAEAFVLSASTVDGVRRHGSPEAYRADHGAARFCHPDDFYGYLRTMAEGEYWATVVDPVGDASFIACIDREYGIH